MLERKYGLKEATGGVKSCADREIGEARGSGTTLGTRSIDDLITGGGGEEHGIGTCREHNTQP